MTDLDDRLSVLDWLPSPDLWPEIRSREPAHQSPSPMGKRPLAVGFALAVGVAGIAFAAWAFFGGSPQPIEPPEEAEIHRIHLPGPPQPIAAGEGAAWVSVSTGGGHSILWRIDARTEEARSLPNTEGAGWPAAGDGSVWVTCPDRNSPCAGPSVLKLDPFTGETVATVSLPGGPNQVTIGLGSVWVTLNEGLARIDPVRAQVIAVYPGQYNFVGVASGAVWTTSYDPDRVYRIDPETGQVEKEFRIHDPCTFEATGSVVWVASCDNSLGGDNELLTKIDAPKGEILLSAQIKGYGQMRVVNDELWLVRNHATEGNLIEVVRIDPRTGSAVGLVESVERGPTEHSAMGRSLPHVFVAFDGRSLWLTDYGAGDVVRLGVPSASAPAGKIAFAGQAPGSNDFNLYTMNADGTTRTMVATLPGWDSSPSWSPDGSRIAFHSASPNSTDTDVYLVNADGTGLTLLREDAFSPDWSPDGTRIVFASGDQDAEIFVMNADGTGEEQLTDLPGYQVEPDWSPDGGRIVFVGTQGTDEDIYVMNADGSGITALTDNRQVDDLHPAWSPDGTRIVFASSRQGKRLFVMNADGTGLVRISTGPGFDYMPEWSPDGSKIAFASTDRDGNLDIYVMNADGTGVTRLTDTPELEAHPVWQP